MKRTALILGLVAFVATPVAAQWLGMPAWNSPKGGTGVSFYGDYGAPSDSSGGGSAFGGRASLGLGTITLTAGVASWKPANQNARATSYGATAAFRLIGRSVRARGDAGELHRRQRPVGDGQSSFDVASSAPGRCQRSRDLARSSNSVTLARRSTAPWSKTPSRRDSHSGQRSTMRQWRGPSSDQSSG